MTSVEIAVAVVKAVLIAAETAEDSVHPWIVNKRREDRVLPEEGDDGGAFGAIKGAVRWCGLPAPTCRCEDLLERRGD